MSNKTPPDNLREGWLEIRDLVMVRGTVQEFFPVNGKSSQILPPGKQRIEGEEGGGRWNPAALDLPATRCDF